LVGVVEPVLEIHATLDFYIIFLLSHMSRALAIRMERSGICIRVDLDCWPAGSVKHLLSLAMRKNKS
jgi:hypothetical protein